MQLKSFLVTRRKSDWSSSTDINGVIKFYHKDFALQGIKRLIKEVEKVEKSKHGYELYIADNNEKTSIYLRFGNVTVKVRDEVEQFVIDNWGCEHAEEQLALFDQGG